MATGSLDANGIWQYGEDDSNATFSALLNRLGTSTSDTVTRLEEMGGITTAQAQTARGNLKVPYQQSANTVTVVVTASAVGSAAVTFPVGRFAYAPLVQLTKTSGALAKWVPHATNITTSGMTVNLYSGDGGTGSGSQPVAWHAIQFLSSAAAG